MKIVVLCGGVSTERAISIVSGVGVCKALRSRGHEAILRDVFFGNEDADLMDAFPEMYDADSAAAVLISSIACRSGACGYAAYAAAKGALEGLLKPAAAELTPRGVRVNAVALGIVDTPMVRSSFTERASDEQIAKIKARYPLGFGTPSDVADVVDFFLGTASRWISGQVLVADGGLSLT